jgi:hypothetical protein
VEKNIQFQKAHAFGGCISDVKQIRNNVNPLLSGVRTALDRLSPPDGWLPEGPDDPFIVAAFEEGWPASAVIEILPVGPHQYCPKCNTELTPPGEEDFEQTCPQCGTDFPLLVER